MKMQDLLDDLTYLATYAPDFPEEDGVDLDGEIEKALSMLQLVREKAKYENGRQLFGLAGLELVQAKGLFLAKDGEGGRRLVREARDHIREGLRPSGKGPTFVGGADGRLLKVPE